MITTISEGEKAFLRAMLVWLFLGTIAHHGIFAGIEACKDSGVNVSFYTIFIMKLFSIFDWPHTGTSIFGGWLVIALVRIYLSSQNALKFYKYFIITTMTILIIGLASLYIPPLIYFIKVLIFKSIPC